MNSIKIILLVFFLTSTQQILASPLTKRQATTTTTTTSSNSSDDPAGDLLKGLSGLFGAAMQGLSTLIQVKQEVVMPAVVQSVEFGRSVIESPVVGQIVDTAMGAVGTLVDQGPAIARSVGNVVNGAGEATGDLLKTGLCTFVCPMQSDSETCKANNQCNGSQFDPEDYVLT